MLTKFTSLLALCILIGVAPHVNAQATTAVQADCHNAAALVTHARELRAEWRRAALLNAIAEYSKVQKCWEATADSRQAADAAQAIGEIHFIFSDFAKARDAYTQALALRQQRGDPGAEAGALADLAYILIFLDQKDQAKANAERALSISRSTGDKFREAQALFTLGVLSYFSGDLPLALDQENYALVLARETRKPDLEARILLTIGMVRNDLDDLEDALSYYQQSLSIWKSLQNRWGQTRTLTSMGLAQTLLGDRQSALESLKATLPALREMGDRLSEGAALNNIAYVYQTLGELSLALDYYAQALKVFDEIKFAIGQVVSTGYCADVYVLMSEFEKALPYYERALAGSRAIQNYLMVADALNNLGSLYFSKGEREKSRKFFEDALAEYRRASHWRGLSWALNNLGYYFEKSGDTERAKANYIEALTYAKSSGDREGTASILYNLARVESSLGALEDARTHIEESLKLNEASRSRISSQDLRVSYFASIHQHYEFYVDLLMQLHRARPSAGYDVQALQVSEKARARSLLELLTQSGATLKRTVPPELLQRERLIRSALNSELFRKLQASSDKNNAKAGSTDIAKLELEYEEIKYQIRTVSADYASIALPQTLDVEEVQRKILDDDTAILEYSLGEKRSFVWVITSRSVTSYELPPSAVLEQHGRNLIETLVVAPSNTSKTAVENNYSKQAEKISSLLFDQALSNVRAKRLVIIGDGVLQNLPYPALTHKQTDTNRALIIDDFEVVRLPSISVLSVLRRQLNNRPPAQLAVAVVADPVFNTADARVQRAISQGRKQEGHNASLAKASADPVATNSLVTTRALRSSNFSSEIARLPFSRQEAQAILSLTSNDKSFSALDFNASRANVLSSDLSKYRIIHFATHGLLNSDHPELSGVLLSMVDEKGRPQDGFLQLNEIYNLNLQADLVVLSACQTGLGKDVKGEGLVGLTRGFMYAGATRVVASLWKVDDAATAQLMSYFYQEMFTNQKKPAAALRAAQLKMAKHRAWKSPYYWAGFIIQGEWN
jgi:CHAT domain-containing protein/Tfp pilus assembly protein PilF